MGSFLAREYTPEKTEKALKCLTAYRKEICEEENLGNLCLRRSLYSTNDSYLYYSDQLSVEYFFDLYLELCGISCYDDGWEFEWNLFRKYLCNGYNHIDILMSDIFVEDPVAPFLDIEIVFGDDLDELDFQTDLEKRRLWEFGIIGHTLLKGPDNGQELFCSIAEGDIYTGTFAKSPFMTEIFKQFNISTTCYRMSTLEARLRTYKKLQNIYDTSVEDFIFKQAEAGLYLTKKETLSQCFKCGGIVKIGQCDFDSWYRHAAYNPCCPYLLKMKGQKYIDKVRRDFKKQVTIEPKCVLQFDNRSNGPVSEEEENDESNWSDYSSDCSDYFCD